MIIIPKDITEKVLQWEKGRLLDWCLTGDKEGIIIWSKEVNDDGEKEL